MPPTRRIADRRVAQRTAREVPSPSPVEVLVFDDVDPAVAGRIPVPIGLRVLRPAGAVAFESALRSFRRGVVALAVPPGTTRLVERVARQRRARAGLRALLVNDPGGVAERVEALAQGFDDAVPDSAGAEEIAGRLLLLAVRTREDPVDRLTVGPDLELDLVARALRRQGRLIHLRPLEFRLLEQLARNPGRPLSRQWLLREVWATDTLDGSRTVDVHVRWLRAKVERDPERPERLLTVRGVGYQLELGADPVNEDAPGPR